MYRRGIQVIHARLGLISNNRELIYKAEYFSDQVQQSLLTDFHRILEVEWRPDLDAQIYIIDEKGTAPTITWDEGRVLAVGDFSALEERVTDRRYTLFGNLGFLYRYIIFSLEKHYRVYSFHASAMFDEEKGELWLIPGGPGAGKTVLLLAGLSRGYTIFSTEMTHFRIYNGQCEFYKGSLFDNVRIGNLTDDFPEATSRLGLTLPRVEDPWATKIALDLKGVETSKDILINPPIHIVHPKVESGREKAIVTEIKPREKLVRLLFDNATEKHGGTFLLYDCLPVPSLDNPFLMKERFEAVMRLLETVKIITAKSTLCGARNCMEGI